MDSTCFLATHCVFWWVHWMSIFKVMTPFSDLLLIGWFLCVFLSLRSYFDPNTTKGKQHKFKLTLDYMTSFCIDPLRMADSATTIKTMWRGKYLNINTLNGYSCKNVDVVIVTLNLSWLLLLQNDDRESVLKRRSLKRLHYSWRSEFTRLSDHFLQHCCELIS